MSKYFLLCLWFASAALADAPLSINCEYYSGYLYSLANLRDGGKSEQEVLAAIDKRIPPKIQKHLQRVVSQIMFAEQNELSKQALSLGYLAQCTAHNGHIPENDDDE